MDEWPMLIVSLHGKSIPVREADTAKSVWIGGQANQLSQLTVAQPLIDNIHFATKNAAQEAVASLLESRPHWLRRDQAAFSCFLDAQLW